MLDPDPDEMNADPQPCFLRIIILLEIKLVKSVFWIRDILAQVRIRGSLPLIMDPDPAFFVSG